MKGVNKLILFNKELHDKISEVAKKKNLNFVDIVRLAVTEWLEDRGHIDE